jgi:hypothetical protein
MALRSLRALGVASSVQIGQYMGAGRYGGMSQALDGGVRRGAVVPVEIEGPSGPLPGLWYAHQEDLEREPETAESGQYATTLVSPFDNLIIGRQRTLLLFDFDFRMEVYVPASLRRYGYYVLPILHRDQLIGRADLRRDPVRRRLVVVAVHGEPGAPGGVEVGRSVHDALERLARCVGMDELEVGDLVSTPPGWTGPLRA